MALSALIFDVDGTLAETEELHRRAFNEVFRESDLPWSWDFALYRDLLKVTGGKERISHFVSHYRPPAPADIDAHIGRLHAAKNARYGKLMAAGELRLRPGVARLLRQCADVGIRLAIATTTSRDNVAALLASAPAITGMFAAEQIVVGEDVVRKKPDPEVYAIALERLGLPASACLAIEDSRNGLIAARAAGLGVIVTPGVYTSQESFGGALALLSDLGEPEAPYRHLAGQGAEDRLVDPAALARWHRSFT